MAGSGGGRGFMVKWHAGMAGALWVFTCHRLSWFSATGELDELWWAAGNMVFCGLSVGYVFRALREREESA